MRIETYRWMHDMEAKRQRFGDNDAHPPERRWICPGHAWLARARETGVIARGRVELQSHHYEVALLVECIETIHDTHS